MANSGNDGALESFLDEWVTLVSGCTPENEFCDNAEGLAIVEKEPTGPYLPEWMICSCRSSKRYRSRDVSRDDREGGPGDRAWTLAWVADGSTCASGFTVSA
jgi:hypothetical protein